MGDVRYFIGTELPIWHIDIESLVIISNVKKNGTHSNLYHCSTSSMNLTVRRI